MDSGVKQRLIGACVLIASAVIFLPSLLERPAEQTLDTTSEIPPEPSFTLYPHTSPQPPQGIEPPPDQSELFVPKQEDIEQQKDNEQPPEPKIAEVKPASAKEASNSDAAPAPQPSKADETGFDESGLPRAWVVQVASFSEEPRAGAMVDKLKAKDYRAYYRQVNHLEQPMYRVFVGPKVEKKDAEQLKQALDKELNAQTLVLKFTP